LLVLETRSSPDRLLSGGSYQRHATMVTAMEMRDGATIRATVAADIQTTAVYILDGDSLLHAES
jgi:hypothetical protein